MSKIAVIVNYKGFDEFCKVFIVCPNIWAVLSQRRFLLFFPKKKRTFVIFVEYK